MRPRVAISIPGDDAATFQTAYALSSTSASNRAGYKSAAMDAAIHEMLGAPNDAARTAAFKKIAELWTKDVPSVALEAVHEYIAWTPKLHGVTPNQSTQVHLDKAWLEK
jgi:ABC-type oligopeptide transport system substrate-binding subunit